MRNRWTLLLTAFLSWKAAHVAAQTPRVLPEGTVPHDARLSDLKTLNGHFPIQVPENVADWHSRAEQLKRRVLVATGLWPMPEKTTLEPVIHGKVTRPGFTVQRVYFQSLPGHYVTGLLFRPEQPSKTPRPGVLSPHGHGGRMQRHSDAEIKRQLANGAEHFEGSGRMPKLARCAQLARMGCVTFIFDMLGYADSIQISHTVAHRHKDPRKEERRGDDGWVFYSIDADMRLQSIMGLQTWNAIRALDFLASLPDVDPERLAVTGGSGGGTQSILLGAIDDRIKVSFPNGMVSTSMQGGCYCENCNYLRVGTGNVELAALFAPKPQAMTAANDWTRDMMDDGYPELRWLYAMLGNEEDVYCRPMLHFKHNYNYVTRATMYQWMNRHLKLGLDDPVIENDFEPLSDAETKVWTDQHPAPTDVGPEHERKICRWFDQQAGKDLENLKGPVGLRRFRETLKAWAVIFDIKIPSPNAVQLESLGELQLGDYKITKGLLRNLAHKTELPCLSVQTTTSDANKVVIWTDGQGKDAAFDATGQPGQTLKELSRRARVLIPDVLGQGEFNAGDLAVNKQRLIDDQRSYSAFTFGYNRTLVADRANDLLTVVAYARQNDDADIRFLSTGGSAPYAAAVPVAVDAAIITKSLIDTGGFRFTSVESYQDAHFAPGAVKYGDLPALLGAASSTIRVAGEGDELPRLTQRISAELPNDVKATSDPVTNPANLAWLID